MTTTSTWVSSIVTHESGRRGYDAIRVRTRQRRHKRFCETQLFNFVSSYRDVVMRRSPRSQHSFQSGVVKSHRLDVLQQDVNMLSGRTSWIAQNRNTNRAHAMAKLKKDVWKDEGWQRGDPIPGGNQGHTFLARKSTDPPDAFNYVLKKLKRQTEMDRRAMFCAEILAMEALEHPGVIGAAASNAKQFREDVELFLITPRVVGRDLEQIVQCGPLSLEDAVRVTIGVLGIIDHCHRRGVLHRDIKPCHVILREDSLDDPVLIDFGLAYHRDTQPSDAATEAGQGKGNRFLIGPEHLTRNPDINRDTATDICQCLGLLFYAITKKHPGVLRDEQNRKPHELVSLQSLRPDIHEWKRNAVLQIFDIGFEWEPSHRWQTIDRLVSHLNELLGECVATEKAFRFELADIMRRAKNNSLTSRFQGAREMADELVDLVQSIVSTLSTETQEYLLVKCGPSGGLGETLANMCISFEHKIDRTKSKAISFVVKMSCENQVDVTLAPYTGRLEIFPNDEPIRLNTYGLGFAEYRDDVQELLWAYLTKCVAEVIGVD